MHCANCGNPIPPGNRFCSSCGAPASPPAGPAHEAPPQAPARKTAGEFFRSPPGIGIIIAFALLVVVILVVGLVLGFRGGGTEEPKKEKGKTSKTIKDSSGTLTQAIDEYDKVEESLADIQNDLDGIDFKSTEAAKGKVERIKSQLEDLSSTLESTMKDLEEVEDENVPEWQKDCASLLIKAGKEGQDIVGAMDGLLTRGLSMGEFATAVNNAANSFEAATGMQNQAADQHAAQQYAAAKSSSQNALGTFGQARGYLDQAKQLEPGADLSKLYNNVAAAEAAVNTFIAACDAVIAGNIDQHNALVDQYNQQKNSISIDMTFNAQAYFGDEVDKAVSDMEDHAEKAEEYIDDAKDLIKENK